MDHRLLSLAVLAILTTAHNSLAAEDLRLARIFGDHMVLQQEKPINVWGWAKPGAGVEVTLTQEPAPDPDPTPASGAYSVTTKYVETNPPKLEPETLTTTADATTGRWSVTFPAAKASFQPTRIVASSGDQTVAANDLLIGEIWLCAGQSNMAWANFNRKGREAASADFPGVRYVAWHDSYYKPLDDLRRDVSWRPCTPQSAKDFSAIPYLFGTFLHRYLKVPVGVINVARGGTLGQTWCARDQLDSIDHKIVKTVLADYDRETATWDDPVEVEKIMAAWRQSVEQAKAAHAEKVEKAKAANKPAPRLRAPKQPADPRSGHSPPAGLFNATVMPVSDLNIRGVLYYQGENNNFMRWTRYAHTFPKIPVSFRSAFRDATLPFGCISQPGWGTFGLDPEVATVAEGYANVRDIQRRALGDDPHADMIATYPTGNSYIHPGEKLPVAEYASLWALAKVYGEPVVHRANELVGTGFKDGHAYLFFDQDPVVHDRWKHIENNAYWQVLPVPREGNAELQGFIIAGADRRWYPAKAENAKLEGRWSIRVSSEFVPEPVAVRYGWANWPTGNMVGRERLPMATFRTDDWPLAEGLSYTKEAQATSSENIKRLKEIGAAQALDRKIRQAQLDLPELESQLHKGDAEALLASKLDRIEGILKELESDSWLSRTITKENPELPQQLKALRTQLEAMR